MSESHPLSLVLYGREEKFFKNGAEMAEYFRTSTGSEAKEQETKKKSVKKKKRKF